MIYNIIDIFHEQDEVQLSTVEAENIEEAKIKVREEIETFPDWWKCKLISSFVFNPDGTEIRKVK